MRYNLSNSTNWIAHITKVHHWPLLILTPLVPMGGNMLSIAYTPIAQVTGVGSINRPMLKIGSQGESVSELQATLALLGFYSGPVDGVYRDSTAKAVSQFKQVVGLAPDGIVDTITWQKLFPSVPNIGITTPRNNPENRQPTTRSGREGNSNNNIIRKNTQPQQVVTQPPARPIMVFKPTPVSQRNPKIQYTQSGWAILRLGNTGAEVTKLQRLLRALGFFPSPIDGKFSVTLERAVKAAQLRYGLTADGVVGGQTWDVFIQRLPRLP
ncbi:peptidoglycan-binding protein [Cylindrospermopsis raciborskii UAM/DH-ZRr]|jgi:peptidoglycan hydrolase-like protein with peptidoglycan-binding domain|nr:peptidoglycan-binding protein [Cylindrospermopsis raciborskii]UJS03300.1 peptidoglycan-binding protein [Cylindrospermopsis raciborskii KLL07]